METIKARADALKGRAGAILNNQYNKAMYSAVTGYALDFLFQLAFDLGRPVSPELQSKSLILAMALVALLVPNKNIHNGEENNMSNMINTKLPLVVLFVLGFGLSLIGCAKHVGQDNVPKYAAFVQGSMELVAEKSLDLLDRYAPEQVQPTLDDLNSVLDSVAQYEDGTAEIYEVGDSIATLLERVNLRLHVVKSSQNAALVLDVITAGGRLAALVFNSIELDDDAATYVKAVGAGIRSGVFKFDQSRRSPVAFFVYPLPYLEPTTLAYSGSIR